MPTGSIPKYARHKPTNQARVRIGGRDFYLGVYGSPESHQKYARIIADWQTKQSAPPSAVTVGQLTILYRQHCQTIYVKHGRPTSEVNLNVQALRYLNRAARNVSLADLSPRHLKQARQLIVESGVSRGTVNKFVQRIRRAVRWAVAEELCASSVLVGMQAVADLRRGQTAAPDLPPVAPVPQAFIDAIEDHVPPAVWGMIQMQLLTGMRPGEVRIMRGRDLNTSGPIWEYQPSTWKTEHHGKGRLIVIGEKGQQELRKWLRTDLDAYLFPSSKDGNRAYRHDAYNKAVARGCEKATKALRTAAADAGCDPDEVTPIPAWSPNRLRHNFGTAARREFGIEAARVTLGHSSAVTSELYAEKDLDAARAVVARIG